MEKVSNFFSKISSTVISFVQKYWLWLSLALIVILSVITRLALFKNATNDYYIFLQPWYEKICLDAKAFLASDKADYTPTYMYFLVIISWFKVDPDSIHFVYSLKVLSMIFEYGTAVLIFFIVKYILKKQDAFTLIAVALALFLPQILLNGSYWGQCDSIYTFFIVLSIFFLLKEKPFLATVSFAVSFAFKLQAIFFLPVLVLLWFKHKYKLYYLLIVPVIYIIIMIPAMICGRSFLSCMLVYFEQAAEYEYVTMNAPTLYIFIQNTLAYEENITEQLITATTYFGFALIIVLCVFLFLAYKEITMDDLIKITFLVTLFAPFVLPRMHERYFYIAEVISILYIIINPKKWYISLLAVLGTFQGYNNYLFKTYYFDNINVNLLFGATLVFVAIILLAYDVFKGKTLTFKKEESKSATK